MSASPSTVTPFIPDHLRAGLKLEQNFPPRPSQLRERSSPSEQNSTRENKKKTIQNPEPAPTLSPLFHQFGCMCRFARLFIAHPPEQAGGRAGGRGVLEELTARTTNNQNHRSFQQNSSPSVRTLNTTTLRACTRLAPAIEHPLFFLPPLLQKVLPNRHMPYVFMPASPNLSPLYHISHGPSSSHTELARLHPSNT